MKKIKSQIVPIRKADIDTDLIIPAQFLTVTTKQGLGKNLFARLRESDPNFPLNLSKFQNAEILVGGRNFGCGSSREHAAWALADWGIQVVLAPSFADIFYSNALKNGILPVVLDEKIIDEIFGQEVQNNHYEIEVDLKKQIVFLQDGKSVSFAIDPYHKECLIKGMDDVDYLLSSLEEIKKFDKRRANIFFDTSAI